MDSHNRAAALLPQLQQIFSQCKAVNGSISAYQSGNDADYKAAVGTIFTPAERTELVAMLTKIDALVADWTLQHAVILAIDVTGPGA